MRMVFRTVFCFLACGVPASAQSSFGGTSGVPPAAASGAATTNSSGVAPDAASGAAPPAAASPQPAFKPIRSGSPVAAARTRTIELGLGYSYASQAENQSKRLGLRGLDASATIGSSRLGIKAEVGYAQASNVLGTGRHSVVFSYLAGPVFRPTMHRNFDTYVHALVGGAKVGGPVLTSSGLILLGGWTTGYAWTVGGGVEYWITDSMAIRTGADYMRTSFYDSSLVVRGQYNLKTTAAVVYYLGKRERRRR
jgi:opacity protein-like surface antigen